MSTPYIGFGNDTLAKQPKVAAGDSIICPTCGQPHQLRPSDPPMLLFYECSGKPYLAAINGRSIIGVKSDVSGEIPENAA